MRARPGQVTVAEDSGIDDRRARRACPASSLRTTPARNVSIRRDLRGSTRRSIDRHAATARRGSVWRSSDGVADAIPVQARGVIEGRVAPRARRVQWVQLPTRFLHLPHGRTPRQVTPEEHSRSAIAVRRSGSWSSLITNAKRLSKSAADAGFLIVDLILRLKQTVPRQRARDRAALLCAPARRRIRSAIRSSRSRDGRGR